MDRSILLRDCRQLLREIHCEAVIDTSDQNLYDILICSEEKKIVLLSWLIQNLFTPAQCARSSFEDILSMFVTNAELTNFLKGSMSVKDQYDKWILLMTTVKQMKERTDINPRNTLDCFSNGKLLDELIDLWNQKLEKPSVSLHPTASSCKPITDIQNELKAAREQLKQIDSLSESKSEITIESTDPENEFSDTFTKFLDEYPKLKQRVHQLTSSSSTNGSSESPRREHFIEELQKNPILVHVQRNLSLLHDIMDTNALKNSTG